MNTRFSVRAIAQQGLFAAGMALCAWIQLPLGDISFTLQTFALFLALFTLGGKRGSISFLVYLLMGLIGFPVFSGFRGGIGVLLGATGGYIWGLALAGLLYWVVTHFLGPRSAYFAAFAGMLLCYFCGTGWFALAYAGNVGWWAIMLKCVVPFLLPDIAKILLAHSIAQRLRPMLQT